jgi:hypothetical protein
MTQKRTMFKNVTTARTYSVVENKDLQQKAKISSRHESIRKQLAIALELFNTKSLEYRLLVWLCEQL